MTKYFYALFYKDQDLLEDVLIELKQAQEMASIYSGILSGVVEAFGTVISNNLNIVMWRLTIVTIILEIPTMVCSFYGMNIIPKHLTKVNIYFVFFYFFL